MAVEDLGCQPQSSSPCRDNKVSARHQDHLAKFPGLCLLLRPKSRELEAVPASTPWGSAQQSCDPCGWRGLAAAVSSSGSKLGEHKASGCPLLPQRHPSPRMVRLLSSSLKCPGLLTAVPAPTSCPGLRTRGPSEQTRPLKSSGTRPSLTHR